MEILHLMIEKASSVGLLTPLAASGLRHRTSIYADDVVTFLRPLVLDFKVFAAIIQDFGDASGLRINMDKCSANLIRCSSTDEEVVARELRCPVVPFPLRYLGLPLTLRKPTTSQLQYLVDKVANKLPGWRASLLDRGGRLELIRATLSAIPIFSMMSLDIPAKTLSAIEKIIRGFLWKGRKDVKGGHCLVAWDKTDRWLPEGRLSDIAPNLSKAVPKRAVRLRKVREGLAGAWLDDIPPDLDAPAIRELFEVADRLEDVALLEGVEDSFRWGWEKDFSYSARSGYRAMFGARVDMPGAL
ncbi:hypothetical protein ACQ4PT_063804 [Festuca glaucescens]